MISLVLDTNVLVSGLLSSTAAPGAIVDGLRTNRLKLVLDDRIFAEYLDVLRRPKFAPYILPDERTWILDHIFNAGNRITAIHTFPDLPDSHDACFLEIAASAQVPLVTGNLKHFPKEARRGVDVVNPAEFVSRMAP